MKAITRKRALEIAQECIQHEMKDAYNEMMLANASLYREPDYKQKKTDRYIDLAAALAYLENMARQKEMDL